MMLLTPALLLPWLLLTDATTLRPTTLRHERSKELVRRATAVSSADQASIVDQHNTFRAGVTPTAKDMTKMYWNDAIADGAQKWADTCPTYSAAHDSSWNRMKETGLWISLGQNWAQGSSDWTAAIKGWHDEVDDFTYGSGSNNGQPVGHYTQVVRGHAVAIGCGFKDCSGGKTYVCNYAYGQMDYTTPYEDGSSCGSCSGSCDGNKLCDCGAKVCQNGGTLKLDTCACDCKSWTSGDQCETQDCSRSDPPYCSSWPDNYCQQMTNVPTDCPHKCGVC